MNTAKKSAWSCLLLIAPILAFAQKKDTSHPSAPAKSSAPAPAHNTGTSNAAHPGGNTGNRPGTNSTMSRPGNTMAHPGNTTGNRPGTTGNTAAGRGTGNGNGMNKGNANMGRGNTGAASARNNVSHTPPGRQVSLRGGGTANIRPNGQIRSVNRNGMHIERGVHGGRTVVSTRNGVRVVSVGRRGGYVQRAYVVRGGHAYYSRTYYYHGAYRAGVYRGYYWGGHPYYGYYPAYYYHPVYYGWAYNPWPAPVYYGWGWGGAPWYGYYGPYYAPYPVYPSAYFWLTDYMIAASLQAAYEAQAAANANLLPLTPDPTLVASLMPLAAADAPKATMSEEVKKAISEEVKQTLAAEKADAEKPKSTSSGGGQQTESKDPPPALDANFKYFVVSSDISLESDEECALSQGDVIERTSETPDDDSNIAVKVVAASKNDCAIGKEGTVSMDDLQEMYNSFREGLKDGMGELAKKNGTGGLPKAPDTTTSDGDVPAPPPDKSAEKSLQDQQTAADQAETEVKQEAASNSGGSN